MARKKKSNKARKVGAARGADSSAVAGEAAAEAPAAAAAANAAATAAAPGAGHVPAGRVSGRVRRYTLTAEERAKVERIRPVLCDVWTPFFSMEAAAAELESDAAPQVEICFWETLAEAFVEYCGDAILVKPKPMPDANAATEDAAAGDGGSDATAAAAIAAAVTPPLADAGVNGAAAEGGLPQPLSTAKDAAAVLPAGTDADATDESDGNGNGAGADDDDDRPYADLFGSRAQRRAAAVGAVAEKDTELVPLKQVAMPWDARLEVIAGVMPQPRRIALLQRLFYLTQAPPSEMAPVLECVGRLKAKAPADALRDVNLLHSWATVRQDRADKWIAAETSARLIIEGTAAATAPANAAACATDGAGPATVAALDPAAAAPAATDDKAAAAAAGEIEAAGAATELGAGGREA